jgi:hypothetical protein
MNKTRSRGGQEDWYVSKEVVPYGASETEKERERKRERERGTYEPDAT